MKLIDKYIISKCFFPFIYCLSTFLVLITVIDLFENLDVIIKNHVPIMTLIKYYLLLLPSFTVQVSPIAVLMASVYILGQLSKFNEISAMRACGINLFRIIVPFLCLGFFVSLAIIALNETVVPQSVFEYTIIKEKYISDSVKDQAYTKDNIALVLDATSYFIKKYDIEQKQMFGITILQYDQEDNVIARIDAERGEWRGPDWKFFNGTVRNFEKSEQTNMTAFSESFFTLLITPDVLSKTNVMELMPYKELKKYIKKIKKRGYRPIHEYVVLYNKIAEPFSNFIVLLVGIPIVLMVVNPGIVTGLVISLVVCFSYKIAMVVGISLGNGEFISPLLAAWFGNFIFLIVGSILMLKIKK